MVPRSDILILFFHPLYHKSRVQRRLTDAVKDMEGVTFRNMYDLYPDFHLDVKREQDLLVRHDLIIWQHPLYWYSSPSLLKEWIDLVLEHGFAFGRKGRALEGKQVMSVISTGGREETYMEKGANRYSLQQLLAPFEQTVTLCRMQYLPPFVVHGTHLLEGQEILHAAESYGKVVTMLRDGAYDPEKILSSKYINELINT
ncbi:MAG: NAD(P)H-dependent oxidoreductase [Bacteroidales bacterium]